MQPTPTPPLDPNEERSWRYGNIPLYAAAWQVIPAILCALAYTHVSQRATIALTLLLFVPIIASVVHAFLIAKRLCISSLVMALATSAVGAFAMLLYVSGEYLFWHLIWLTTGPKW